mgnify:FL=1
MAFRFTSLSKENIKKVIQNIAEKEKIKIEESAFDSLYELSDGDVRRVVNLMQSCASKNNSINSALVYELMSIAEPKEINIILEAAIQGKFLFSREKLLDTMLKYGLSGLDLMKQIQKEILRLNISEVQKAKLIERCGEIEFRMVEGSDEFLQLEALLASFSLLK